MVVVICVAGLRRPDNRRAGLCRGRTAQNCAQLADLENLRSLPNAPSFVFALLAVIMPVCGGGDERLFGDEECGPDRVKVKLGLSTSL